MKQEKIPLDYTTGGSEYQLVIPMDISEIIPHDDSVRLLYAIFDPTRPAVWRCKTVNAILRNRMYLGEMVQGTFECSQFRRTPPQTQTAIRLDSHAGNT